MSAPRSSGLPATAALRSAIRNMETACKSYDENVLFKGIATLVPELHHIHRELPDNVIHLAGQRN